jgi:hypothetical protein
VGAGVEQGDQCGLFGRIPCTREARIPPNTDFFEEVQKSPDKLKTKNKSSFFGLVWTFLDF